LLPLAAPAWVTALQRLLSFAAGSAAHDNWHQAVVGRSKDALGKSRLCSQQRPMG